MSKTLDDIDEDGIDDLQDTDLDRQCLEWQGQTRTITGVVVDLYFCVRQGTCHIEILEDEDTRTPVYMPTGDTKLSELPQLGDPVTVEAVEGDDDLMATDMEVAGISDPDPCPDCGGTGEIDLTVGGAERVVECEACGGAGEV